MPTIASCVCIVPTVTTASMVHRGQLITTTPIVVIVSIAVRRTRLWPAAASTPLPHQQIRLGCTSHLEVAARKPISISPDTHAMIPIDMPRHVHPRLIPHAPDEFHYRLLYSRLGNRQRPDCAHPRG